MEIIDLIKSTILPIIDVILVAVMLYYAYKLVRGTAAIIVFRGFVPHCVPQHKDNQDRITLSYNFR